jgi:SAM-dependent methyltransferase
MTRASRSTFGRAVDSVFFPYRAIFVGYETPLGLSTIKEERMRVVAKHCFGRVLDIGCGPGNNFITDFIGLDKGVGIDVYPYEGVTEIVPDPEHLPYPDASFDCITLIAVGGHIPKEKRVPEFQEFARVLKPGGRLIMTEGEPITQWLAHKWYDLYLGVLGRDNADTERGMEEGEQYCMPRTEIDRYLNTGPLRLVSRHRFMWGLNNVFVAEKKI